MSSDFSKDKLKPFLARLNDSKDSIENDESVYAPTRKLPRIPLQLSELYEDMLEESPNTEPEKIYENKPIKEEDLITQSNIYRPSFDAKLEEIFTQTQSTNKEQTSYPQTSPKYVVDEPSFEPELKFPSFEVKMDPNSLTAKFEKDTLLKEQLESADFYIEQGFLDVAFSTLERLEMVFPGHPLISERLEKMATVEIKNTSQGIQVPFLAKEKVKNSVDESPKKTPQINEIALNENIFRVPNTAELQSLQEITPQEPEVYMDFNNLVANNTPSESEDYLEQASEDDPTFNEIPAEFYQTINDDEEVETVLNQVDEAAAEIAAIQNGLGSLIDEIEEETFVEDIDDEFSGHFNIGQAYFDIELFDDAVEEFQTAYRTIQHLGTTPKMFQCCMLLGKCFRLKEMPRPALIWLKKALETKQFQGYEQLELLYEMAVVNEELGEQKKALELYREIAKIEPDYQDVSTRLSNLT